MLNLFKHDCIYVYYTAFISQKRIFTTYGHCVCSCIYTDASDLYISDYHLLMLFLLFFVSVLEQSGQQLQPNLAAVRARCQMLKYIFFLQWHHGLWLVLCMDSLPAMWLCSVLTACGCGSIGLYQSHTVMQLTVLLSILGWHHFLALIQLHDIFSHPFLYHTPDNLKAPIIVTL